MSNTAKYRNKNWIDPDQKRKLVLDAAVEISRRDGYLALRREDVASHVGIGTGSVNKIFGTMNRLRDAIVEEAIRLEIIPIVADAIANRHPLARSLPEHLKTQALMSL